MVEPATKIEKIRIDLGCGKHKKEGFIGLDQYPFWGVDYVAELGTGKWPLEDATVDEGHSSHFVEHLTAIERIHFANELFRVLKPGAFCTIIVPHWASHRAYGDPTHQWPPISEMWFYYLNKKWRMENAPHTDAEVWDLGFNCDFEPSWGYGLAQHIQTRNEEFQQFAVNHYKDAIADLHATIKKRDVST